MWAGSPPSSLGPAGCLRASDPKGGWNPPPEPAASAVSSAGKSRTWQKTERGYEAEREWGAGGGRRTRTDGRMESRTPLQSPHARAPLGLAGERV